MDTVLLVVAIIIGAWILMMAGLRGFASLLRRQTSRAAHNAVYPEKILLTTDNASYLGAGFPGPNLPPRTSGCLTITENRLFFLPWFPRKSITLPRHTIHSVRTGSSFDGATYSIPVLVLSIKGVGDPAGDMAWLVHHPEDWEKEIRSILTRESKKEG